jgi:hypothetical protein
MPAEPEKPTMTLEEYEASKASANVALSHTSEQRAVKMNPSELESLKLSRGKAVGDSDSDPALNVSTKKTVGSNKLHRGSSASKQNQQPEKVVTTISANNTSNPEAVAPVAGGGRGSSRKGGRGGGRNGNAADRSSRRPAKTPPQDESAFPALGK